MPLADLDDESSGCVKMQMETPLMAADLTNTTDANNVTNVDTVIADIEKIPDKDANGKKQDTS